MFPVRLRLLFVALLLTVGCASHVPDSQTVAPANGLPEISALRVTADANEFLIQQRGADFAGDLPLSRCAAEGDSAAFMPAWTGAGSDLSDTAFAIYRLTFDPAEAPVRLELDWTVAPQIAADCWIGISDWESETWRWVPGDAAWEFTLDEPSRYLQDQHCYVAVLLLGDTESSLAKLGFGEPVTPPLSADGYTLIAPLNSKDTFLIDMDDTVVHSWTSNYFPGASAMLLENGHLLRAANLGNPAFNGGGMGGRIVEFDWDGSVHWYFELSTPTQVLHHDFTRLPNGNILAILYTNVPAGEVIDAGRDPATMDDFFWTDSLIEIEPVMPSGGNIVWEWHALDHVVQDFDFDKGGYSNPADHPELIDINYPPRIAGDWTHFNCVAYNAQFDQVVVSVPFFNELWVIDHSTTAAEAAGHTGGTYGKGGDLLYRWGNPQAYRQGGADDQQLFFNHDTHWIADGLSGAGDILIFNNQLKDELPNPTFSSIVQITPPQNPDGSYFQTDFRYGPDDPTWEYIGSPKENFFSPIMSSAQRLRDGSTLICEGASGTIFQVDSSGAVVWEYDADSTFRALRYTYDYPGVAALQQ